jgi:hypothetical protein
MNAADIAVAFGKPRREGRHWRCLCPLHGGHSLIVGDGRDGRIIFKCWGGCDRRDLVAEFRRRHFINGTGENYRFINGTGENYRSEPEELTSPQYSWRIARAATIWDEAGDPRGTVAEKYLAARALKLVPELCGRVLRFHPACPWRNQQAGIVEFVAAMIVLFSSVGSDAITGIHRIRLDQPERWPKADRMMLGRVTGSAAKLDPVGSRLVIGEGVETCLAARQLGLRAVWALGSASGIENFMPIGDVEELIILGENDNGTNHKAALKCRQNWPGCHVTIIKPRGAKDTNDIVMGNENVQSAPSVAIECC